MNRLIDGFGRHHNYLRISVTDRCNLRCVYCMPHDGMAWKDKSELLTYEEIVRVARVFVAMGIDKIRLTGGEPLVRSGLERLVRALANLPGLKTMAMTTNATLLSPKVNALKTSGLTALNISLDTFKRERFLEITRRDELNLVLEGIEAAIAAGFESLKLNMVVISGFNDDEVIDFADYAAERGVNARFIEYMPFKDNNWKAEKVVTFAELKKRIEEKYELVPMSSEPSAVAKDFSISGTSGSVSFITSMSDSFCNTCNRLRLTSDGSIKSCLFYPAEINLRDAIRAGASDQELEKMILYSLSMKPEAHPAAEEIATADNRAMIEIGG